MTKESVLELLRLIPKGKVTTYGKIAEMLGNKKCARAVGNILHSNKDCTKYPCYKVVNGKGMLSSAYAFGGVEKQRELLEKDGIEVRNGKVDLVIYLWRPESTQKSIEKH